MNYDTISKFFEKILKIDGSLVKLQKGKENKIPSFHKIKKINSPARHYTCQDLSSSAVYFYR
jgi:hypothetical protein